MLHQKAESTRHGAAIALTALLFGCAASNCVPKRKQDTFAFQLSGNNVALTFISWKRLREESLKGQFPDILTGKLPTFYLITLGGVLKGITAPILFVMEDQFVATDIILRNSPPTKLTQLGDDELMGNQVVCLLMSLEYLSKLSATFTKAVFGLSCAERFGLTWGA